MTTPRINSRSKGKAGELEFIHLLADELGIRMTRNLVQTREGGCDLIPAPEAGSNPSALAFMSRFAVEVKRYGAAKPSDVEGWWRQAVEQAHQAERLPLLAYRTDRAQWLVRMPLEALDRRFAWQWENHCTVPFPVFKAVCLNDEKAVN